MTDLDRLNAILIELGVFGTTADPVVEVRRLMESERKLLAVAKALKEALQDFGRHAGECDLVIHADLEGRPLVGMLCTCGLTAEILSAGWIV